MRAGVTDYATLAEDVLGSHLTILKVHYSLLITSDKDSNARTRVQMTRFVYSKKIALIDYREA